MSQTNSFSSLLRKFGALYYFIMIDLLESVGVTIACWKSAFRPTIDRVQIQIFTDPNIMY